ALLHTAVTVAPKCLASCTAAEPMLPEAPMIRSSWPAWTFPRSRRKYSAVVAPNGTDNATALPQRRRTRLERHPPLFRKPCVLGVPAARHAGRGNNPVPLLKSLHVF